MKRSTKMAVLAALVLTAGIVTGLALSGGEPDSDASAPTSAAGASARSEEGAPPAAEQTGDPVATARSEEAAREADEAARQRSRDEVARAVAELRELYGYAGVLDTEAARALIAKRQAAADALVARLAALGPASVGPILKAYADAETGREKLMLVDALGQNPAPEAAQGLASLLGSETTYSYRQAIVEALGESRAPGAGERLAETLGSAEDPRVRVAAIMALGPGEAGTEALVACVDGDPDVNVRISAVTRLAEVGGASARGVLDRLAGDAVGEPRVRAAAIAALARSFPEGSVALLGQLADDGRVSVRAAVVSALERLRTTDAAAILRHIASDDAEATLRARAERALARMAL